MSIHNGKEYRKQMRRWISRQLTIVHLKDEKNLTLQQIGDRYGISKQRAKQLYDKGRARMEDPG